MLTCINDWDKNGIMFFKGCKYRYEYTPYSKQFFVYAPDGRYTELTNMELKLNFI